MTCGAGIQPRDDLRALAGDPGGHLEELGGVAGQAAHHQCVVAAQHKAIRHPRLIGLEHGWKKIEDDVKEELLLRHSSGAQRSRRCEIEIEAEGENKKCDGIRSEWYGWRSAVAVGGGDGWQELMPFPKPNQTLHQVF